MGGWDVRAEDDETFTFDVYHDVSFIHNHLVVIVKPQTMMKPQTKQTHSIGKPPFLPRTLILLPPHPSQHPLFVIHNSFNLSTHPDPRLLSTASACRTNDNLMRLIVQVNLPASGFDLIKGRVSGEVAEWFGVGSAGDPSADGAGWVEVDFEFGLALTLLALLLRLLRLTELKDSDNPAGMVSMPM